MSEATATGGYAGAIAAALHNRSVNKIERRARKTLQNNPWLRTGLQFVGIVVLVILAFTVVDALAPRR